MSKPSDIVPAEKVWPWPLQLHRDQVAGGMRKVGIEELARSFLDKPDEDWTFVDPEDVKRLARAVLELRA